MERPKPSRLSGRKRGAAASLNEDVSERYCHLLLGLYATFLCAVATEQDGTGGDPYIFQRKLAHLIHSESAFSHLGKIPRKKNCISCIEEKLFSNGLP